MAHLSKTATKEERRAEHKAKMARKAQRRALQHRQGTAPDRVARNLGCPAGLNRRTRKPHKHAREIARRTKES